MSIPKQKFPTVYIFQTRASCDRDGPGYDKSNKRGDNNITFFIIYEEIQAKFDKIHPKVVGSHEKNQLKMLFFKEAWINR